MQLQHRPTGSCWGAGNRPVGTDSVDQIDVYLVPEKWSGYKPEFGACWGAGLRYFVGAFRLICLDFSEILVYHWNTTIFDFVKGRGYEVCRNEGSWRKWQTKLRLL